MRLQVFLSHSGACSRRMALELVKKGLVTVNGETVIEPSFPVSMDKDKVCLSGSPILLKTHVFIILNKPKGVTTTRYDRHAETTVMDLLPDKYRHLYPVGRLDRDSQGLLLLTNDGDLALRLSHPRFNIDKKYLVQVNRRLEFTDKQILEKGIILEGKRTYPCKIRVITQKHNKSQIEVTLHEGRKRQIKRMLSTKGYRVISLTRVAEGPLRLDRLKQGNWRLLRDKEIKQLRDLVGLK